MTAVLQRKSFQDDDDEGGEAFDLSKMDREQEEEDDGVRVHEIKFDEYGIMDDGLDDTTSQKLASNSQGGTETHGSSNGEIYM